MKKYYILFALLFVINTSFSQTYQWVKNNSINLTTSPDNALFPSCTDASGNIITGELNHSSASTSYFGNILLKKYNNSGTLIMTKLITGKAVISGIETDGLNNIYVYGIFLDTLTNEPGVTLLNTGSGFNQNTFFIKLNNTGSFLWKKNITEIYGNNAAFSRIRVKNNFIIAGIDLVTQNSFIKKFDLNGNETQSISQQRTRSIGSVDADINGNIYAAGSCAQGSVTFGNASLNCPYIYSLYFVKYTSTGTNLYTKFVEDITFENPIIICDDLGNAYAAGELNDDFVFGSIHTQGPQWVYDFYLTKIDPTGNFLWVKEVPNNGPITGDAAIGKLTSLKIDGQNNIYLTGFQRGTVNWGSITTSVQIKGLLVLQFNSAGNLLFAKVSSGTGESRGDAITLDNNGNLFVSGNLSNTVNFDTISVTGTQGVNAFISKLSIPLTSVNQNQNLIPSDYSLSNYPNPFNPETKISFEIPEENLISLNIYNSLGELVATLINSRLNSGKYSYDWNAASYPSGVYFYTLQSGDFRITSKMVLLK